MLEALLFFVGLLASELSSGLGFLAKALGLGEFGAAVSLRSLLLLTLFLDLQPELFLLFLLLFDDSKVVMVVFIIFGDAWLILTICLLVILSINRGVVFVLTTTALALVLALVIFIIFWESARKQVTLLTAKLIHKVLLREKQRLNRKPVT